MITLDQCQHTLARTRPVRGFSGRQEAAVYVRKVKHTTGTVYSRILYVTHARGVHVPPGLLAGVGCTVRSILVVGHAHVPLLLLSPYEG